jgi:aspartyl-tRNA(Asn)/glutamyl-tRNA(Gln) amidotransferase subunit A
MAETPLYYRSVGELGRLIRARELSCREVIAAQLERIEAEEPRVNAFITVTGAEALREAEARDRELAAGEDRGPLQGMPIGVKDIYATAGVRTTAGSKILASWIPDEDAHAVALLRRAGAVLVGKLNTHEFAYGASTINPHYGNTHNPWRLDCIPGGSSGGSGAAVAAGLCAGATGSDTGGSIRMPAGLCGVVGIKPTYGLVSRHGIVPLSWSLDHAGPLARTVEDTAILLGAMAGYDSRDPATVRRPAVDYRDALGKGVAGLRVGICRAGFFAGLDSEVEVAVAAALGQLEALGASLIDEEIPDLQAAREAGGPILTVEATAYHERWLREVPEQYGEDVRRRAQAGV